MDVTLIKKELESSSSEVHEVLALPVFQNTGFKSVVRRLIQKENYIFFQYMPSNSRFDDGVVKYMH